MWNLFKNCFRSLSKNKIAIIGLTFLIFISIGTYVVLSSCTTAISKTYDKICKESNLHDFTVNELYKTSDPVFKLCEDDKPARWSTGWTTETSGEPSRPIPWYFTQTTNADNTYQRTYYFELDYSTGGDNSVVYDFWNSHKDDPQFADLLYPSITFTSDINLDYRNTNTDHTTTHPYVYVLNELKQINTLSGLSEIDQINALIKDKENQLVDYVNNLETPMQEHMRGLKQNGIIDNYQKFEALNINSSSDDIYYKVVDSNPEDTIDKISTFDNYKNLRQTNFSANLHPENHRDYNPLNQFINKNGESYGDLLIARDDDETNVPDVIHCPLPQTYVENPTTPTGYDAATYTRYVEAKIILLSLSHEFDGLNDVWQGIQNLFNALTNTTSPQSWGEWSSTLRSDYNKFAAQADPSTEHVSNLGYRLTIKWSNAQGGGPSWQADLWNTKFAFVNPQYMDANNKKPLDPLLYENNESYKTYKNNHGGDAPLEDWLNSIPYSDSNDNTNADITQATTFKNWFDIVCSQYPQYTVVNTSGIQTQYLILGAGITANFIYPIVSFDRPIPNYKKECIVFTNSLGYKRINSAFKSSEAESYLVAKFNNNENNKSKILNAINDASKDMGMMYPSSMNVAYMYNDTNNMLSPAALRVAFIPNLIKGLTLVSLLLTIFILILALLICAFVINQYISSKRIEIGIMRANGVRRRKIVFSLIPFAMIPAIIGGVIGYVVGFLLQGEAVRMFHNYWTIPTQFIGFNIWTLLICICIPFLVCFIVSTATTALTLRKSTVQLFKSDGDYKTNIISKYAKRSFASLKIITRFRVSLAFNCAWKLLVLIVMSMLAMSSIVFAMSLNGKFDYSKNTTYNSQKYTYAVDLYSPTTQGGQYIPYDSNWIGQNGFVQSNASELPNFIPNNMYDKQGSSSSGGNFKYDQSYENMFPNGQSSTLHLAKDYYQSLDLNVFGLAEYQDKTMNDDGTKSFANMLYPTLDDGVGQQIDINYLKNRSMTESFMNFNVGIGAMASNPWKIATALMPENNKNIADSKTKTLINEAGHKAQTDPEWQPYKNLFKEVMSEDGAKTIYVLDPSQCVDTWGMAISMELLEFQHKIYNPDFILSSGEKATDSDYNIQYNQVPLGDNDETYTYLSTVGVSKNIKGSDIKIVGLKDNSNYVSLLDSNKKDIASKIQVDDTNYQKHPIIVNAYAAKQHKLKIGDVIQVDINNNANRFDLKLNNQSDTKRESFTIVGINQTFQNEEYFISQNLANELLGLKNTLDPNTNINSWYYDYEEADKGVDPETAPITGVGDGINSKAVMHNFTDPALVSRQQEKERGCNITPYGFNGIFTDQKNGGLLNNGFYLYSPSGLYPASDLWSSTTVGNVIGWGANTEIANQIIFNGDVNNNPIAQAIDAAYQTYSANPTTDTHNILKGQAASLIDLVKNTFGDSAYVQTISNVIDKIGQQQIYDDLSNTISTLEAVILTCVTLLVSLIVILISSLLINNSKRMGAILKALGYSDRSVLSSFLSVYIPTIILALLIAIPISMLFVFGFTNIIFGVGGILLTNTIHWWYYLLGVVGVMVILSISGFLGYRQLTKESLASRLKTNI